MGGNLDTDGTGTFGGTLTASVAFAANGSVTVAGSQTVDMGANRVRNIATPAAATDATTKAYVDGLIATGTTRLTEGNTSATVSDSGTGSFAVEVDSTTVLTAASGGVTMNSATVSDLTDNRIVIAGSAGALEDAATFRFNGTTFDIGASGSETFQVTVGSGNTVVGGTLNSTGKITAAADLEVDGAAVLATAKVEDLTSGRVVYAGTGGEIQDSANLTFDGTTVTTTALTVDNISVDGNTISSGSGKLIIEGVAGQEIVVNEASADVDFRIESDNDANAFVVEGSTGNVGLGTATPTTDATLHISATDSMIIPVGTTAQRPGSPATGTVSYTHLRAHETLR